MESQKLGDSIRLRIAGSSLLAPDGPVVLQLIHLLARVAAQTQQTHDLAPVVAVVYHRMHQEVRRVTCINYGVLLTPKTFTWNTGFLAWATKSPPDLVRRWQIQRVRFMLFVEMGVI